MTQVGSAGRAPAVFRARRIGGRVLAAVVGLCVVAAVALALAVTLVPLVVGGRALTVLSGSMSPAIPEGSVVVIRPVRPATLAVGDVVSYATTDPLSGQAELVTHRIAGIGTDGRLTTKGDANRVPDGLAVSTAQVRGEVWFHIPFLGSLGEMLFTRTAAAYAGAAALVVFGIMSLRSGGARHDRQGGRGRD